MLFVHCLLLLQAEIIRITKRDNLILSGHTNYVQGVAWDPLNAMVVTESSDRSCKVHQVCLVDCMAIDCI